jgi:hypothetical protein
MTGCSGDCGCGGTCGCEVSLAGEGFVRPTFFGGMLLTEDDLQAVVDYGVAKRRLTNRLVIGAGVVCGLDVTCHPCDPGKVQVGPGYAIECCGNDILVSCPEEVDVIALVRDLRVRAGVDCGEPCDEQPGNDYMLYVRYAEQPTEPVAPYAQDDCATGECEFSRVREGYCFELRCEEPDPVPTIIDALEQCRPSDDDLRESARRMAKVVRTASQYEGFVTRLDEGAESVPAVPTKSEFDALAGAKVDLSAGLALVNRSNAILALDAAAAKGAAPSPRLNEARRTLIRQRVADLAERLRESPQLRELAPDEATRIDGVLTTAQDQPDLSGLGPVERAWLAEGTSSADADREFIAGALAMRGKVLKTLDQRGQRSCDEYRRISRLRFEGLTSTSKRDALILARSYLETFLDCVCGAFNPPCPTCTDDAVALAKVTVDGCEVTHVCALERQWVVSPRAFGYWFPVVEAMRRALDSICCPDPAGEDADRDPAVKVHQQKLQLMQLGERTASTLAGAIGDRPELAPLLDAIGRRRPDVFGRPYAAVAAPAAMTVAAPAPSVAELQARVEELKKQVDALAGKGGSP